MVQLMKSNSKLYLNYANLNALFEFFILAYPNNLHMNLKSKIYCPA